MSADMWSKQTAVVLALLITSVIPPDAQPAKPSAAPSVAAFVDVNVVPMDRQRILERQTVIVHDGRISAMGPARTTRVPNGAVRIDGRGKYLMPGLAEMHAHIPGANAADQLIRDIMFLYVANGITAIRGMLGAPNQLTLRRQTASGEVLGPTIFVGAPSLNGNSAPTPDSAAKLVRAHKAAGYDFLKLHPGLTRPVYDAIVATAREVGITYAGHVAEDVGIEHAIASRQSTIDHLDGYIEGSVSEEIRARMRSGSVPFGDMIRSVDEAKLRKLVGQALAAGMWNVPTAFLWESFSSPEAPEAMASRAEMKYATRQWISGWTQQKRDRIRMDAENGVTPEVSARYLELRRILLKALSDSGALLLMGTDSPQMFNVPGFSLHHEIALMQEVGLTPYQVLVSGTRNVSTYAARDLRLDGNFGTVAVGNRADLVLLDANPLADVRNVAKRAGVMVRGRWLSAAQIETGLNELAMRGSADPVVGVQGAEPKNDDERDVLAVVQRLFDAMRARDTVMLRSVFDTSARLIRLNREGRVIAEPIKGFSDALGKATESWNERIWRPEVKIDGAMATVWGEYDFHAGTRFSHCGVDTFILFKTAAGWRVVALSDTGRREGCPARKPMNDE